MPFLWLIPRSKDGRFIAAIVILALLLIAAGRQIVRLNAALDAKPKIVERVVVETKIVEKKVAGPVIIREKIVTQPGGEKIVERVIERAEVTTEKGTDIAKDSQRTETPIGRPQKLWTLGLSGNPSEIAKKLPLHDASVSLNRSFGIISVGYGHVLDPRVKFNDGHRINLGIPLF